MTGAAYTPSIGQEGKLERETGFEPATFCLGTRPSEASARGGPARWLAGAVTLMPFA